VIRWLRSRSLSGRLALLAVAVAAMWLVIVTVLVNLVLAARLRAQADSVLRTRAEAVAATLEVAPDGSVREHEPPNDAALDAGIWVFAGGLALEHPTANSELQRQAVRLAGRRERFVQVNAPLPVRFYVLPVRAHGRQAATVVAALELSPYQRIGELAAGASAVLAGLLLAAMYVVTRVSVTRALRPVAVMTEQAAQWSASDTDRRFGPAGRPRELERLALHLDELLGHLSAVLRHEQQLTAELSHELRTPLARILGEAELAAKPGREPGEVRAALTAIAAGAGQMQRVIDTLVTTAQAGLGDAGRCDAAAVTRGLAADLRGEPVLVSVDAPAAVAAGTSATVLTRILAPLLANALRHARREVRLTVRPERERVLVTVSDDGPGVDLDLAAQLFEPGVTGSPDGTGLGLALSRRLARAAGGEVTHRAGQGGACFEVALPPG
jgi:signal transduction histidine kinase